MKTEIKSITVVCQQGVRQYEIGQSINGLIIARIENNSMEFPESLHLFYTGFTFDGSIIFEVNNCPVDIQYYIPED